MTLPTKSQSGRAVVCVSGGMDSCVTAAIAAGECNHIHFMHADYGQRTQEKESRCFAQLAAHFKAESSLTINLRHLGAIGGSSLTDSSIPVSRADLANETIPSSYVPFRNAHFLSAAVSWAEVLGAGKIYIGAVEEDSSGYPDCRREYYDVFEKLIETGTRPETQIEIITPLIKLRKSEIVRRGIELGAPLEKTWSCYSSEGPNACGVCDSCALRLRAFAEAGIEDPLPYDTRPDYR